MHLVNLIKDEEASAALCHIGSDDVLNMELVDLCLPLGLIRVPGLGEMQGSGEEVDKLALQSLREHALSDEPGDIILPTPSPAVEGKHQGLLWPSSWVGRRYVLDPSEVRSQGFGNNLLHQGLAIHVAVELLIE